MLMNYVFWLFLSVLVVLILVFVTVLKLENESSRLRRLNGQGKSSEFKPSNPLSTWWARVCVGLCILTLIASFLMASSQEVKKPEAKLRDNPYSSCLIYDFRPGDLQKLDSAKLESLPQEPPGCMSELRRWFELFNPEQLIVVGQTASSELSGKLSGETYYSRLALARAAAVSKWLADGMPYLQSVLLTSGPRVLPSAHAYQHGRNRSVEIRAYWAIQARNESVSPRAFGHVKYDMLKPPEMLAFLGLVVALSAYLAAVGVYLREQLAKPSSGPKDDIRRITIKTRLSLLTIADMPMITAALLLGLHLFFGFPEWFVPGSVVLVGFSAVSLVLFHATEWFDPIITKLSACITR